MQIMTWESYTNANSVSEQEPIGEGTTYAFHATYDGSGCTISGISFVNKRKGSYATGMFGDNRGILRNIAIVSEYTGGQDSYIGFGSNIAGSRAVAYGGVLAGRNSRTIRNCAAAGYTLTLYAYRNSTTCVGGLVGSNYGTIRECAAETPRIKLSATYANVKLGGFVGQNNGGISSCYAVADIEVMESRQGSVSTAGFAGENLGLCQYGVLHRRSCDCRFCQGLRLRAGRRNSQALLLFERRQLFLHRKIKGISYGARGQPRGTGDGTAETLSPKPRQSFCQSGAYCISSKNRCERRCRVPVSGSRAAA